LSNVNPADYVWIAGAVIVVLSIIFTKGIAMFATLVGALGGILFSSTGIGRLIQGWASNKAGVGPAPDVYHANLTAIGVTGILGFLLIVVPFLASKGTRVVLLLAAAGGILLASSPLGQGIYNFFAV
jgi:hypothetical protein